MRTKLLEFYDSITFLKNWCGLTETIRCIEILAYFAYKTVSFEENFSELNFSNQHDFEKQIYDISRQHDELNDKQTSKLLQEIVKISFLKYSDYLNEVYKKMLELEKEEIESLLFYVQTYDGYSLHHTDGSICDLLVKITDDFKSDRVLDVCSGKGNILYKIASNKKNSFVKGIEINSNAALVSKMKLNAIGANYSIINDNVLSLSMTEKFDLVFCHYPWGIRGNEIIEEDVPGKIDYKDLNRNRLDWAFIIKALNSIGKDGKAIAIVPSGALFSSTDVKNRKKIVEGGFLESVVLMPQGTIAGTGISYCLLILSNGNKNVSFIDVSEKYDKVGVRKLLKINDIVNAIKGNTEEKNIVPLEKIAENGYNLSLGRYAMASTNDKMINPNKLEEVATVVTGYQYTSKTLTELPNGKGNVSVVKANNIDEGLIDYESLNSVEIELEKVEKYLLKDNDILVTNKGNKPKFSFVQNIGDRKVMPCSNLTIIRVKDEIKVNPVYLYAYLSSETGISSLQALMRGSVLVFNISRNDLLNMMIPVLDVEDQDLIATRFKILDCELKRINEEAKKIRLKLSSIYSDKVGE